MDIQTNVFKVNKIDFLLILIRTHIRIYLLILSLPILSILFLGQYFLTSNIAMATIIFSIWLVVAWFAYDCWWVFTKVDKSFFEPKSLIINSQEIIGINQNNITTIDDRELVTDIEKTLELKKHWVIYLLKKRILIIPKSAFKIESDQSEFLKIVKNAG